MHSDISQTPGIRPFRETDRLAVEAILHMVGNFNPAEIACALELVDIYLHDPVQEDYLIAVAESGEGIIGGYVCYGPTPMTRGTFDLYWIATRPDVQGKGYGRALMAYVEQSVASAGGRLLVVETSSKESYGKTVGFYRRAGYEEASRILDFYDTGDDRFTFVKRFSAKEPA